MEPYTPLRLIPKEHTDALVYKLEYTYAFGPAAAVLPSIWQPAICTVPEMTKTPPPLLET